MSAIGAIFRRDGSMVPADDIDRMTSSLRIHGPLKQEKRRYDTMAACWTQGEYFTPEDRLERQPIISGTGGFLFSGRLDYRGDLARALNIEPAQAKTMADSALAHAAWREWGRDALLRIEGAWAFIALDPGNQSLFAARAPLAAPPLVYHDAPGMFAIASMPKGLFALPAIPREMDEQHIADALILNFEEAEKTYFRGVNALRIGHWMEIRRGSIQCQRYYDPTDVEPVRFINDDDYVDALDALMRDAIETSMRADKTPATTVSAGLDSSTVSVYALEALERGVHGFTDPLLGFTHVPGKDWDGRSYGKTRLGDESGPVKALAAMYPQFDVTFVPSEGLPLDHKLDEFIRMCESPPYGWNNIHWGMEIARLVREAGRSVLLSGSSGNRTISLSNRYIYPELLRQGRWLEMHRLLRGLHIQQGILKRYYRYVAQPLLPAFANKAIARFRNVQDQSGWQGFSPINGEYAAEMRVSERAEEMGWDDSYTGLKSTRDVQLRMTSNGNIEKGALAAQGMQGLTGVQGRDPLGDRRLTEYCFAIPADQFMTPGTDRWLVRRLMKDRLPSEIVDMRQRGRQSADWHARFTKDIDRYREEFEAAASDPDMARRFDIPRIRKIFETWPDKTPLDADDHPDYAVAMVGIGRMFGMSRFIDWVDGKNK
ncbi:asparagine synthetase B family protein [Aurantiacibacter marinus]|uniref:asparagine synthase (glutamine-hydrolyzing) n=1 Tax=Aurantiacibacter marinus TaxID=874156 RepID=A0A0H0XMW4_9SPHN|nr:asparagine synthase-related protein [Aurantiacibacter marinus]KLI63326.1 hypothetical protein AAV99_11755 [Aurantiacibacter marinus]